MSLKLFDKGDKKKLDKSFKRSLKEIKKLSKDDAKRVLETYDYNEKEVYNLLKNHAKKMIRNEKPNKFLNEWQELNEKTYAHYLRLELIKELKKRI